MRVVMLYRPSSEFARRAEGYVADFERFHPGQTIELLNVDTPEGSNLMQIYGLMEHPAILALKSDGQVQQMWQGIDKLPLMNDLAYYAQQ